MNAPLKESESSDQFADLLASHQPRLAAYIRSLVIDEHATKDILQETNVTLLRKAKDFETGTNFAAWSFRVAFFEVLTWRKRKGRDRVHFDTEVIETIASDAEALSSTYDSRLDHLQTCLDELPERQSEVVRRRYLQAESVTNIAAALGFNANAASQLLFRARQNLLRCMTNATAKSSSAT